MSTKIKALQFQRLRIPFRTSFKHSSAERSVTQAVIAIARTADSTTGYGEGCPRAYVTGESLESCEAFLETHRASILEIDSLEALKIWVDAHATIIDKNPAAWCAIETAILDAFGKAQSCPIEALLDLPPLDGSFTYTAVFGAEKPEVFSSQLAQYLQLGLRDFKIKISGNEAIDKQNFDALHAALPTASIRFDANNLWTHTDQAIRYLSLLSLNFWAIEEPLQVNEFTALQQLAESLQCQIILDESFCRLEQFISIELNPRLWIPNIRISKMGGLLRSLTIAQRCQSLGMKFILGAQVGETSLLTRIAMTVANTHRASLLAQEGAFGVHLLTSDITAAPLMFGKGGKLSAPAPSPGHGIACVW